MTIDMTKLFGLPVTRVDGVAKVTGAARYASDEPLANPAYAYLVTSTISRGRLTGLMLDRAKAVPGVLDILTHENVGSQVKPQLGPRGGPTTTTLESDRIWHDGQIIAVVVAETFEAAREAANKVEARYDSEREVHWRPDRGA
jgi:xanthine dehydrogenase YagR molybdenum-binding subunit